MELLISTSDVDGNGQVIGNFDVDGATTLDDTTVDGVFDVNGRADIDNVRIDGNTVTTTNGNLNS